MGVNASQSGKELGPFAHGMVAGCRPETTRLLRAVAWWLVLIPLVITGCESSTPRTGATVLLFNGTGTSRNDVAAVEELLRACQLDYVTANSQQLNRLSDTELATYRLLIVPGGNYIKMGDSLTASTTANIRRAVQGGLNYLGICAGGLLAGDAKCNSLNLTSGVRFGFYSDVNRNIHKAAVPITCVGKPTLDHYWEDGPQFTGWGDIVGKYPDGTPAIVEGEFGQGWVVLCGVHPEAPAGWRKGMKFTTSADVDHAHGRELLDAALSRKSLPHY